MLGQLWYIRYNKISRYGGWMKPDTKYTYSAMGFMTIHDLKYCDCKSSRLRDPSANCSYSFFYNLDVEDETRHKIHILRHGFSWLFMIWNIAICKLWRSRDPWPNSSCSKESVLSTRAVCYDYHNRFLHTEQKSSVESNNLAGCDIRYNNIAAV